MKSGLVVLIRLPIAGGSNHKLRPALVLANLPGDYQNILLCGISTKIYTIKTDWDELIRESDYDFLQSGLQKTLAVRLSYLYSATKSEIVGVIGNLPNKRMKIIRERLITQLQS